MEYWEQNARARAHHPDDEEMRLAAHYFVGTYFGGCFHRAAVFFDEFANATQLGKGDS